MTGCDQVKRNVLSRFTITYNYIKLYQFLIYNITVIVQTADTDTHKDRC